MSAIYVYLFTLYVQYIASLFFSLSLSLSPPLSHSLWHTMVYCTYHMYLYFCLCFPTCPFFSTGQFDNCCCHQILIKQLLIPAGLSPHPPASTNRASPFTAGCIWRYLEKERSLNCKDPLSPVPEGKDNYMAHKMISPVTDQSHGPQVAASLTASGANNFQAPDCKAWFFSGLNLALCKCHMIQ